ncbi:hypothetical protein J2S74_002892 [Evansella vedderi]|uniref:Replication-relaxation n=1 Tax=Evansella vedderi TaxID=38282 RepID=A0ABT9ZWA0_9BACI|nr:replication-relaxation family protein [Evansella vedderi]MDQ0255510.1 hypothetical protein [Evansella vedderi]
MSKLLEFDSNVDVESRESTQPTATVELIPTPVSPEKNPYKASHCPSDIYELLPPDGSTFGLFADPYASMKYVDVNIGNRNGRYWLEQRLEDYSFTDRELKLLEYLSEHRVGTRSQIERVVFPDDIKSKTVIDFLKKSRQRGIICSFSWVSPLDDGRKKPLVYGLTRVGAEAASKLFYKQVSDEFWFHPIKFPHGKGPNMTTFFLDLAANELYSELVRIDRIIDWQRRPQVRLSDGTKHYPASSFEVIKDKDEMRLFWLETVRVGKDWVGRTKNRFQRIQSAFEKLPPYQKPVRLIILTDSDSRISFLGKLAHQYMPDVKVRFTTDERLLQGIGEETFISYKHETEDVALTPIPIFKEDYPGMTASEYLDSQEVNIEDEEDDWYEE